MRVFSLLLSVFVVGCATIKPMASVEVPDLAESQGKVAVLDVRPAEERLSETFSMVASNCAFGIDRYGDETLEPTKVRLLQHRAYEKLRAHPEGISLKVHNFVVYHNIQAQARNMGFMAGTAGMLGAAGMYWKKPTAINDLFYGGSNIPSCEPKEVLQAYYHPDENPRSTAMFIVHLDAELNGKRNYVRHVFAYEHMFGTNRPFQIQATEAAIASFLRGVTE